MRSARSHTSHWRLACNIRDHFLALDPPTLTVDDFEKHLLAAEKNILAVGAARGTPRSPLFEGCSPSPLTPSYASAAAAHDYLGAEEVGAAFAPSGKRRSGRGGKGGRGGGCGGGGGGGAGGGGGGGGAGGRGGGGGGSGGGGGGGTGSGGGGSGSSGGGGSGGGSGGPGQQQLQQQQQEQQRQRQTPTSQQLLDWYAGRGALGAAAVADFPALQQLPSWPCPRPAPAARPRRRCRRAPALPTTGEHCPALAATATTAATAVTAATAASAATAAPAAPAAPGVARCSSRAVLVTPSRPSSFLGSSGASGSGQVQLQRRPHKALSPQQLREWYAQSRGSLSAARCPYVIRTGVRTGQPCEMVGHTGSRCLARLRTEFGDDAELPDWVELLRQRIDIFALDYDAILIAMYALSTSAEGACHVCLPPDPGIHSAALGAGEAAALGASASAAPGASASAAPGTCASAAPGAGESAPSGAAPAAVLHTFTLDSGASRSFFRDSTMLTPLSRPVAVSLADPSGGPVLAHSSTVLPCLAAPSGLLSGLHLPSFSTNLVCEADLQDAWVDQFTPGGQRVTHYTCSRTGRHLATFTRRPGSSLYTLTTAPPSVSVSGQVATSSQVFAAASRSSPASAPCSCRPLSHETLLWHHRLGHPSLPRLQGMASRALVSGLPRSLPPLPPGPAPTCVPCVEGRQRATPHSSAFPPTEAPLQTLHMDVWGPARVRGQGHERYFLLVVDNYSRYTSVFPLHRSLCLPWLPS
ncbi:unnamed protein product [Closterium sp. NIES-54]